VKLHEFQSKRLLAQYGIPVPPGLTASTPDEARSHAATLGCSVVLKAQIHAGGRGKAGGIVIAETPREAKSLASKLLGTSLRTAQTGVRGLPVKTLLVEPALAIANEAYAAFMIEPSAKRVACVLSAVGGADIELIASSRPEGILSLTFDPVTGMLQYQARKAADFISPQGSEREAVVSLLMSAYRLFVENDCSLLEFNPLAFTSTGKPVVLDAKITIDDSALFRHADLAELKDETQLDPIEREASRIGVSYVKLDGSIGCLVNGAGLAMATMDLVALMGGKPANFLDVGGAATEDQVAAALHLLLNDPDVKVAWVNIFGGILRCDIVAHALLRTREAQPTTLPFVVRLRGTNAIEATELLMREWPDLILESDLSAAAERAVRAAGDFSRG